MRTRLIALAVTTVAVGALSGCGAELDPDVHPGRAAVVEGQDVTFEEVDELADQYCALQREALEAQDTSWPMSYLRSLAVGSFVDDLVAHEYAQARGFDSERAIKVAEQQAESLVAEERAKGTKLGDEMVALLARYQFEGMVLEFAGRSTVGPQASPQEAITAGIEALEKFREGLEVSVDPRFGTADPQTGRFTAPAGLLSVGSGSGLKDIATPEEFDQAWVRSLPSSQRCG